MVNFLIGCLCGLVINGSINYIVDRKKRREVKKMRDMCMLYNSKDFSDWDE